MTSKNTFTTWSKTFGKIFLLLIALAANFHLIPVQAADGDPSQAGTNGSYRSFNVTTYLTTEGQGQAYFCKGGDKETCNPVANFILQIINIITLIVASLSFFAVVVAGFMMVTAAGNDNQLNKAKEILKFAVIGLVVTLSAYFIVSFVQNLVFETGTTPPPAG
ncbi:hypothetical protein IT411_03065 [Candidatus Peregrinibacteria bacterium]|nr:hypothetical protein [Candidatus Peregrinibacteria bacterium]